VGRAIKAGKPSIAVSTSITPATVDEFILLGNVAVAPRAKIDWDWPNLKVTKPPRRTNSCGRRTARAGPL